MSLSRVVQASPNTIFPGNDMYAVKGKDSCAFTRGCCPKRFRYFRNDLNTLINEVTAWGADNDIIFNSSIPLYTIRFLLNTDGTLAFGLSGIPGNRTPGHLLLSFNEQCLCAGDMVVDANGSLYAINNKSSDFRPSAESLRFALLALRTAGLPFHDTLTIEKHAEDIQQYAVNRDALFAELDTKYHDNLTALTQLFTQTHEKQRLDRFPKTPNKKRNACFLDSTPEPARTTPQPSVRRRLEF